MNYLIYSSVSIQYPFVVIKTAILDPSYTTGSKTVCYCVCLARLEKRLQTENDDHLRNGEPKNRWNSYRMGPKMM